MKITLILISIVLILMGILGVIPGITIGTEPVWHAVAKIVIGLIGLYAGMKGK